MKEILPSETIEHRIFLIRGHNVMLSHHLAELYGVEIRTLVQSEQTPTWSVLVNFAAVSCVIS
jgi:hypothetical protein